MSMLIMLLSITSKLAVRKMITVLVKHLDLKAWDIACSMFTALRFCECPLWYGLYLDRFRNSLSMQPPSQLSWTTDTSLCWSQVLNMGDSLEVDKWCTGGCRQTLSQQNLVLPMCFFTLGIYSSQADASYQHMGWCSCRGHPPSHGWATVSISMSISIELSSFEWDTQINCAQYWLQWEKLSVAAHSVQLVTFCSGSIEVVQLLYLQTVGGITWN
jgi:hypothetical protein